MDSNGIEKKKRAPRKPKVLPSEEVSIEIKKEYPIEIKKEYPIEIKKEYPIELKKESNKPNIKTTLNMIIDEFLDEHTRENANLKENNTFLEGKIKSLEEQLENKAQNMDYLRELEQKVESLNSVNQNLLEENEKLKGIHNGYNKMYVELQEQFVIKTNLIETLQNTVKETKKEYEKFKSEYNKKIDSEIKSFKNVSIMNTYLEEIKTLKNDISILNKQLISSKNLLDASRKENKELLQKLKSAHLETSTKELSISQISINSVEAEETTEETTEDTLEDNLHEIQETTNETKETQFAPEENEETQFAPEETEETTEEIEETTEEIEETTEEIEETTEEIEETTEEIEETTEETEENEVAPEETEETTQETQVGPEETEETLKETTDKILNIETLDVIEVDDLEYYLDLDSNILEKDTLKVVGKLTDDGDAIFY
jgi:chromosome segregation ATPase